MSLKIKKIYLFAIIILLFESIFIKGTGLAAGEQKRKMANFYKIYITKTITNDKILPTTSPVPGYTPQEINITACRGQYEPASFVVHAGQKIMDLMATATDLRSENSSIPASAVDIRVVKCWFQSGVRLNETNKFILTPELLLKDDQLVKVDLSEKKNYLRASGVSIPANYVLISGKSSENMKDIKPHDAATLQPVDIEADTNKQFWITVHVPDNATPGQYQGKIKLSAVNAPPLEIDLHLRVLPFNLEKPVLRYSIYYHNVLTPNGLGIISGQGSRSRHQYLAEMRDLKAHGVEYPTGRGINDEALLREELRVREQAGLPKDVFYSLGLGTGNPNTPEKLDDLKNKVKKLKEIVNQFGYHEVYVQGMDDAEKEKLTSQRAAWNVVHQLGVKIFVATPGKNSFELMGDLLDQANVPHPLLNPQLAEKYHRVGHKIFYYGYPQVGKEESETHRRYYGLFLWKSDFDGAMNFAYQYSFDSHIWNDFDYWELRDFVLAYPTTDGVIDTIQWEGFREGVNDVRYVTTLLKAIQQAKSNKPLLAAEAQKWVDAINPNDDLDALRTEIIQCILKLQ